MRKLFILALLAAIFFSIPLWAQGKETKSVLKPNTIQSDSVYTEKRKAEINEEYNSMIESYKNEIVKLYFLEKGVEESKKATEGWSNKIIEFKKRYQIK